MNNEIISAGKALAEKRSRVRKSFDDFCGSLNERLQEIPEMGERDIIYPEPLREMEGQEVRVALHFKGKVSLKFIMFFIASDSYDVITEPSIDTIRAFGRMLPDIMKYFFLEIRERSADYKETALCFERMKG